MKSVLLIITGSVAAFKAYELIRMFVKSGIKVIPVLSRGGEAFLTPLSVSALAGEEVLMEDSYKMEHITSSRKCDAIIVYPASASFLNKLSYGAGGELALDIILAKLPETPLIIAPAMNVQMWKSEITTLSVSKLQRMGAYIINPESGMLLCEEKGEGRLVDTSIIYNEITEILKTRNKLNGKIAIITNGGTIEKIDDVRFISNFSSGLQGAEIAKEMLNMGATVFLVEANSHYDIVLPSQNLHKIKVESAVEMQKAVFDILEKHTIDYFFSTAAVADFRVKNRVSGKIKKDEMFEIVLEKNPDILKEVCNSKGKRPKIIVGFAVEEKANLVINGRKKIIQKGCDILFVNEMCFGSKNTQGTIIANDGKETLFAGTKAKLAKTLISSLLI